MFRTQHDAANILAEAWNLKGAALDRWHRIVAGSGIDERHGVLGVDEVMHLTTGQRMEVYEHLAPRLAAEAACRALARAGVAADAITDLIVVSCTGFSAPGVDVALVESLGLPSQVRRTMIGFMGCFGAINGLRTAVGACAANRGADQPPMALVVCVELCSLHIRQDHDVQNQVGSALFADGAAAAVVAGELAVPTHNEQDHEERPWIGRLTTGKSLLLPHGRDWMTWRVTDSGFAMTLSREVPTAVRAGLREFVAQACSPMPRTYIVHPGGPGILQAVDEALHLGGGTGLEHSREVLKRYGNMSSATVLFVLEEAMRCRAPLPAALLAFGPGLTIESMMILNAG